MQDLPSAAPERLLAQLRDAVASGASPRRYVRAILADAWRGVHLGDPAAPGRWRGALTRLDPAVRENPDVQRLDEVLEIACTTLRDGRTGAAERALVADLRPLLAILSQRRGVPMSRADLHEALPDQDRWSTPNTLSYPLEQLADAELVLLTTRTRRGGPTRHYALSALGVRACDEAGLGLPAPLTGESTVSGAMQALLREPATPRFSIDEHRLQPR